MDAQQLIKTDDGELLWYDPKTKMYMTVETLSNEITPIPNPELHVDQQGDFQSSCDDPNWEKNNGVKAVTNEPTSVVHSEIHVVGDEQKEQLPASCEIAASSTKSIWDESQTLLLLDLCKKFKEDIDNPRVKKMDAYKKIALEMRKYDHTFTWLQCQNRMKTLLTKYKEIKDHLSVTGNNTRTWAYYDVMLDYIGDRPNVVPTSSLSTLQLQQQNPDSDASSSSSCTAISNSSKNIIKKRITNKTSPRNKMLLWLEQHRTEMKEQEQKRLEVVERHHAENKELFKQFLEAVITYQKK